jgi:hypothetical protein
MHGIVVALCTAAALMVGCGGSDSPRARPKRTIFAKFQTTPGLTRLAGNRISLYVYIDRGYPARPRVRLQADPYPFGHFTDVEEKTVQFSDAEFRVAPSVNTHYRATVTDGDATGMAGPLTVKVYVRPRLVFGYRRGSLVVVSTVKIPSSARPNLGPVYFYARWGSNSRFVRIGVASRYIARNSRVTAVVITGARARAVIACTRNGWLRGTEPDAKELRCGAPSLNR